MNRNQRRAEAWGKQGRAAAPTGPTAQWLNAALAHQRAGRAAEAERMCRQILVIDPDNAHALRSYRAPARPVGYRDRAYSQGDHVIPRGSAFHHNLGNILSGQGLLADAMVCYEQALALAPASVDTLYNLGTMPEPRPSKAGDRLFRTGAVLAARAAMGGCGA
jgi:protein O-GlcNAc transferase